jgi:hypothetical protein
LYKRSCETADVDEAAGKAKVSFSHREVDHKRLSIQPSNRGESRLRGEREKLGRDLKIGKIYFKNIIYFLKNYHLANL